jgi:AMMECR1 domain-containing protein
MVVVVVEATDMAIGKDELIFTTIMVTILTNLLRIKRNKKNERIFIEKILKSI